jgi:raffinose/stachyose/melibiose transport system substrate-binding protein
LAGSGYYAIPLDPISVGGIVYNRKIYQQLGLSVPRTWSEFLANCEKIKAVGIIPVAASYKDTWTAQLLLLADYYNVQAAYPKFAEDYTANKVKFSNVPTAQRGF